MRAVDYLLPRGSPIRIEEGRHVGLVKNQRQDFLPLVTELFAVRPNVEGDFKPEHIEGEVIGEGFREQRKDGNDDVIHNVICPLVLREQIKIECRVVIPRDFENRAIVKFHELDAAAVRVLMGSGASPTNRRSLN